MVEIPGSSSISAFLMGKYEITQKEWEDVMGTTAAQQDALEGYSGDTNWGSGMVGVGDNYPMYHVNWYEAVKYCNALSQLHGLNKVYTIGSGDTPSVTANNAKNGYRLPTVAEWKHAARGGQNYTYAGSNNLNDIAWHGTNSDLSTHPVGGKAPNGYGLYDMNGNVWEWCWDAHYKNGGTTIYRRNCGADWYRGSSSDPLKATDSYVLSYEQSDLPHGRWRSIGFRVVRRP